MVRLPAEWEKQSFIQYTFPHRGSDWAHLYEQVVACFVEIIRTTAHYEPVLVISHSLEEVKTHFAAKTNFPIHFIEAPSNDSWARDHGAITVLEDERPVLLDFTFNGWGKKFESTLDNQLTQMLARKVFAGLEVRQEDFILEGGAIDSDGQGTLLTTSECLLSSSRNRTMTKNEITHYLVHVFGLKKVLWLDHGYLIGDDTDAHIDTLARFCNETTIAYVKCDKPDDEHFESLNKMEAQLKTFTSSAGVAYHLVPLPWPEACYDEDGNRLPATYANFLILNHAVLVPTYGVPQDEEAIRCLAGVFPERNVIGIDCQVLIKQHGSLHCVSMQFPEGVGIRN